MISKRVFEYTAEVYLQGFGQPYEMACESVEEAEAWLDAAPEGQPEIVKIKLWPASFHAYELCKARDADYILVENMCTRYLTELK